jgi:hypothetical protein
VDCTINMSREDNHSLSTESLAESVPESFIPEPVPYDGPQKKSMVRRFSSAASLFFSAVDNESMAANEENNYLELMDEQHLNDLFCHDQLGDQFQKDTDTEGRGSTVDLDGHKSSVGTVDGRSRATSAATTTRTRKSSISASLMKFRKINYWDEDFKQDRKKIIMTFAENYLWLILGFMASLCIYWGAYYRRATRFPNIKFGVFIADTDVGQLPAILGPVVKGFFTQVPALHKLGTFDIWDFDRINLLAQSHNNTISQEVNRQVHHHKYWGIFYVRENATLTWFQALKSVPTTFDPSNTLLEVVFETGRDYNAVTNYISTLINRILSAYASFIPKTPLMPSLLLTLSANELMSVLANAPGLITTMPNWQINDLIPVPDLIVLAPLQIGLIYLVIFTFFQFVFTIEIQMFIASKVKGWRFILLRMLASQFSYLVLSLAFILLNLAFGMSFTTTFGNLGFLVILCFGYLLMSSVGSSIEILVLIFGAINPALIGFVMIFVSVVNVSPTISPIELCPSFYRYGYGIPVRNAYDLFHVAYFNAWKGTVGLNIGVLFIWIVLSNAMIPFLLKFVAAKKAKMEQAAAEPVIEKEMADPTLGMNAETAANTENNAKILADTKTS